MTEVINMGRPFKCPYCQNSSSTAKGYRYNKDGAVRLRKCKACNRRWTVKSGPAEPPQSAQAGEDSQDDPVPEPPAYRPLVPAKLTEHAQEPDVHPAPEPGPEPYDEQSSG